MAITPGIISFIILVLALVGLTWVIIYLVDKTKRLRSKIPASVDMKQLNGLLESVSHLPLESRIYLIRHLFGTSRVVLTIGEKHIVIEAAGRVPDFSETTKEIITG